LLSGSGEVLVYYSQRWRHHFKSGRVWAADKFSSGESEKIVDCHHA